MFGALLFGMMIIVYVVFKWDDTALAETLVLGAFALIGAVVAAYIGGAAYEDVRLFQSRYAESEASPEEEKNV